ncbi:porin family protein [Rapidithrix thailandica]|uniref:Porin family protein n=1 Tax=Rapidithrix thailandica TaxID=413964 RepID=A0AAW9SCQ4_9BACT
MKKIIVYFIILSLLSTSWTLAQDQEQFGLRGGFNLNWMDVSGGDNAALRPGAQIGIFYKFWESGIFSVQPELNLKFLAAKNDRNLFSDPDQRHSVKTNLTYLEIPVIGKITIERRFKLYFLQFGIGMNFLLSSHEHFDDSKVKVIDNVKNNNFNFILGGGVLKDRVMIDLRYERGLTDIGLLNESAHLNGISISLGYYLF